MISLSMIQADAMARARSFTSSSASSRSGPRRAPSTSLLDKMRGFARSSSQVFSRGGTTPTGQARSQDPPPYSPTAANKQVGLTAI
jgi:hypothetical protein